MIGDIRTLCGIGDAIAIPGDLVPQLGERPHLGEFGDEAHSRVDEERELPHDFGEAGGFDFARLAQIRSELPALANRRPEAYRWPVHEAAL